MLNYYYLKSNMNMIYNFCPPFKAYAKKIRNENCLQSQDSCRLILNLNAVSCRNNFISMFYDYYNYYFKILSRFCSFTYINF